VINLFEIEEDVAFSSIEHLLLKGEIVDIENCIDDKRTFSIKLKPVT
jgi:hypothetical protein